MIIELSPVTVINRKFCTAISFHHNPQMSSPEINHVTKKTKYSHVYEKIIRGTPPPNTPPVEGQQFLATPHTCEVVGVSFAGGQVFIIDIA
jgi:hypothetical protein